MSLQQQNAVVIETTHVASRILGTLNYEASQLISNACSYEVQGAEYMTGAKRGPWAKSRYSHWDGVKRLYHKGTKVFPTGLLSKVIAVLETNGIKYTIDDLSNHANNGDGVKLSMSEGWELRDYQEDSVGVALEEKRCMVKVATGGGKTVIAGHIIHRAEVYRAVFLVHTKDLLWQAYDTFCQMFGDENVGMIGDGRCNPQMVTVATLQTMAKFMGVEYKNDTYSEDSWKDDTDVDGNKDVQFMIDNAALVMMDECHRVAAPTATEVVNGFPVAEYRIGFSASPWRDDGADLALEAVFGRVAVNINASWLIERGWLVPPFIRMVEVPPKKFPKGTKYATIYDEYIVNNVERNVAVLEATKKLVRQDRATMVLTSRINHGTMLAQKLTEQLGYEVPFLSGKDDSDKRKQVINAVRRGYLKCFVATTIADEGLDVKPLSGLVLAGGGKSSTRALQRIGRVLRPFDNKKDAVIIDFEDNAKNLYDHSLARNKIYHSEPAFTVFG